MKINPSKYEAPFKAFQRSDNQIPKFYNTNDRLNVTELLTTIRTSTKQTKNTSKNIDLRGRLKTADHCGAVLLFELNSLTYAFCSTSHIFCIAAMKCLCISTIPCHDTHLSSLIHFLQQAVQHCRITNYHKEHTHTLVNMCTPCVSFELSDYYSSGVTTWFHWPWKRK